MMISDVLRAESMEGLRTRVMGAVRSLGYSEFAVRVDGTGEVILSSRDPASAADTAAVRGAHCPEGGALTGYALGARSLGRGATERCLLVWSDLPLVEHEQAIPERIAGLNLLAHVVHVALDRIGNCSRHPGPYPELSAREQECLQWAARGKTSWEIAQILLISEPTVVFHLKGVISKLNASNRVHAVAIGISRGMVKA